MSKARNLLLPHGEENTMKKTTMKKVKVEIKKTTGLPVQTNIKAGYAAVVYTSLNYQFRPSVYQVNPI